MEVCCKDLEGALDTPEAYGLGDNKIMIKMGKRYRTMNYCLFCGKKTT